MTPNLIYHPRTGHRTGRLPRCWLFRGPPQCLCVSISTVLYSFSCSLSLFATIFLSLSNKASLTLSVCQILPKGVVSVIGPASSPASGSTVSHICGEKEVRNERTDVCVSIFERRYSQCSSAAGYYFLSAFAMPLEKYFSP